MKHQAKKPKKRGRKKGRRNASVATRDFVFYFPDYDKLAKAWYVRRRDPATGKRKRFRLDVQNITEAQAARDELVHRQRLVEDETRNLPANVKDPKQVSIKGAFNHFLETVEVRDVTLKGYRSALEEVLLPALNDRGRDTLHSVVYADVEHLFTKKAQEKGWKGRTRQKHYALLKRVFTWAGKHGYVTDNPVAKFDPPKTWGQAIKKSRKRGYALTMEQACDLLEKCRTTYETAEKTGTGRRAGTKWTEERKPPEYLFSAVLLALLTGLRRSNIIGLRWRHLSDGNTKLFIPGEEMKAHEPLDVPLHPQVTQHLNSLLKMRKKDLGKVPAGDDLVLGEVKEFKNSFLRALKRAGIAKVTRKGRGEENFRFHDLRHTFSTWLARKVPQYVKDGLMGHSDPSMSARYRDDENPDVQKDLKDGINQLPWLEPQGLTEKQAEKK